MTMASPQTNILDGPELGVVLDARYRLTTQLPAMAGRPRYLAEDVTTGSQYELVILALDAVGAPRYRVRARPRRPDDTIVEASSPHRRRTADRHAADAFRRRVVLTGVMCQQPERTEFLGWDRRQGRAVRIVIEPLE